MKYSDLHAYAVEPHTVYSIALQRHWPRGSVWPSSGGMEAVAQQQGYSERCRIRHAGMRPKVSRCTRTLSSNQGLSSTLALICAVEPWQIRVQAVQFPTSHTERNNPISTFLVVFLSFFAIL